MDKNENKKVYNETIGSKSLSKTLRNSLIPVLDTQKNIEKNGIIIEDELRAEKRLELKEIMDDYYRYYIETKLSNIRKINWTPLFEAMEENVKNNTAKNQKELENIQKGKRAEIYEILKEDENFKNMFGAKLVSDILPDFIRSTGGEANEIQKKLEIIKLFNRFMSSFTDYFENRKNVFSKEEKSTSICYRVVNDNAWIYFQNLAAYTKIKQDAPEEIDKINENENILGEYHLKDIFNYDFYCLLMTQSGIQYYNDVCGVVNSYVNLFCQKNKLNKGKYKMRRLHKQILSVAESNFEIPQMFQNDKEVYNTVNIFIKEINDKKVLEKIIKLSDNYNKYDTNKIYVSSKYFESLSIFMCENWRTLDEAINSYYENNISGKGESKKKKVEKALKSEKYRSVKSINTVIEQYNAEAKKKEAEEYINFIADKIKNLEISEITYDEQISLIESEKKAEELKEVLDCLQDILHWTKVFIVEEEVEKDNDFYTEIEEISDVLGPLTTIYNRVRNYVTQKPYNEEKFKLNFGTPTLAYGWSKSKEYDNNAIILIRENKYYLGIFNAKNKPDKKIMEGKKKLERKTDYKKMIYMLLPGANKMLPKVFLSKKGIQNFKPSQEILEGYNQKKHIKSSEAFDIKYLHKLIDFFKQSIEKHSEWNKFNFSFKDATAYNDISEFYRDVEAQGYKIEWTYISEQNINEMVENNQLYLFQIYNKDFAQESIGTDNLHTMYLKNMFSEENLRNIVLKLNGEAELFYRKSSIKHPIVHKKGSILLNKTYIDKDDKENKKSIPEKEYQEIYRHLNGIGSGELSDTAKEYLKKADYHEASKDIIKDYRYTVDKYFIHLPMTINYKSTDFISVNDIALKYIANRDDMHIIGIDRGERNLVYVSVIDMHGNIIKQKNYNIVNGVDYKSKLKDRENARDKARKDWKEIGKIKELKEGYLSLVVHEIAEMMVEYNAIIVMEDLNNGFKRGRFKVERQVYQKFETMLINKLNYLVDKNKKVDEDGGLLRGYQLTYVPKKLEELGRQCGFIFYVPAAYTSKIDPTTGFVNIFKDVAMNDVEFITKFDSIKYDNVRNMFALKFDYKNFVTHNVTMPKNEWTIYTNGSRIRREYSNGKWNKTREVWLTEEMIEVLDSYRIDYMEGQDVLEQIMNLDDREIKAVCKEVKNLIKLITQMRNSKSDNEDPDYDKIVSPVLNDDNKFFDSSDNSNGKYPENADANGAYCIALKGLYEVKKIRENWSDLMDFPRETLKIKHYDWFDFIQNKRYL